MARLTTVFRPTGRTYYVRFINRETGYIWNGSAMATTPPSRAVSKVAVSENGTTGEYPIVIPTGLPTGAIYDVPLYLQSGGSPANTDPVDSGFELKNNIGFGF